MPTNPYYNTGNAPMTTDPYSNLGVFQVNAPVDPYNPNPTPTTGEKILWTPGQDFPTTPGDPFIVGGGGTGGGGVGGEGCPPGMAWGGYSVGCIPIGGDPCPDPAMCWNGTACVECNPNVGDPTGPGVTNVDPGETGACAPPGGGCQEGHTWASFPTCKCIPTLQRGVTDPANASEFGCESPPPGQECNSAQYWSVLQCKCVTQSQTAPIGEPGETPINLHGEEPGAGDEKPYMSGWNRSDILNQLRGMRGLRGAQSRGEYGKFGRAGGGAGGGAMTDLEAFENPMLAMGSPYLSKNVTAFAGGGRMHDPYYAHGGEHDPYNYGGKIPKYDRGGATHTMPDGTVHPGATHEEYLDMMNRTGGETPKYNRGGEWQAMARAMNGFLALGQANNIAAGNGRRRFKRGGIY
tara:strand:- start:832 stop:2052 length:1221 start_codon:yes stop_codon:yes gene_type:complete